MKRVKTWTAGAAASILIVGGFSFMPAPASATVTNLGRTSVGTVADGVSSGYQTGPLIHIPSSGGKLSSASIYVDGKNTNSGTANVRANVYGGGPSQPAELLATSSTQSVVAGSAGRWLNFSLSNVAVGGSWDVWLQLQATGSSTVRMFTDGTSVKNAWGPSGNGSAPDPYSVGGVTTDRNFSAYLKLDDGVVPPTPTPTATPTPTPTPTATPTSTQGMPTTSTKPGWSYSYGQDFLQAAPVGQFETVYGQKWNGLWCQLCDTSKQGAYRPDRTVSVAGGALNLHQGWNASDSEFQGANLYPQPPAGVHGDSQEYLGMRTSIRYQQTGSGDGYKLAWLLWGASYNWSDGEIDFPEHGNGGTIGGFSHPSPCYGDPNRPVAGQKYCGTNVLGATSSVKSTAWHIATVEWIPKTSTSTGSIEFFVDNQSIGKTTTDVPSKAMHWQLQSETWLSTVAVPKSSSWDTKIDWLTVEAYTG